MTKLANLDRDSFATGFLEAYLQNGFANMPKREIDLLVLRLLLEHTADWSIDEPPNAFVLAQTLRAKRGRLRSMLDELSFRAAGDEEKSKQRLRQLLIDAEKDYDRNKVRVQIEDGYLRDFAKNLIQSDYGIVDTSFDRTIVSLSGSRYLMLVTELMTEQEKTELEGELEEHRAQLGSDAQQEGLIRTFLRKCVEGAGKEVGGQAIRLGAAALTGGLSEVSGVFRAILGNRDGGEPLQPVVDT
jgi:hypothetical protein